MAEVEISYNGQNIVELNANGEKTLKTGGKYNACDLGVKYTRPQVGITPSGSRTFTQNGTYDVTALAQAIVNVSGGGGSGAVTGTFTLASKTAGPTITHNANLNDYIFVAQMQSASFEALKLDTSNTSNYAVAFMFVCSDDFYDFVGASTLPMNKQGVKWYYKPSTNALSMSSSASRPVDSYTKDSIGCSNSWGAHQGTYDFWAIPLN